MSATDSDVGLNAQITYSLGGEISNDAMSGMEQEFTINPQTGAIVTNKLLDREALSGGILYQHTYYIFILLFYLRLKPFQCVTFR